MYLGENDHDKHFGRTEKSIHNIKETVYHTAEVFHCTLGDGMLIIQPAVSVGESEFSEQILAELIEEGYSGKKLLEEFKTRQAKIRPAVETLLEEAKLAAEGKGKYYRYDDVFGGED